MPLLCRFRYYWSIGSNLPSYAEDLSPVSPRMNEDRQSLQIYEQGTLNACPSLFALSPSPLNPQSCFNGVFAMEDPVSTLGSKEGSDGKDEVERLSTPTLARPGTRVTQLLSRKLKSLGVEARGACCASTQNATPDQRARRAISRTKFAPWSFDRYSTCRRRG
jgi:hypothetical protein